MASTVIQPSIATVAPFADPVYALKSDNGTFKGLFTQTIGTNDAVMFQSNGYSFGWKPDNILYIDDANNMDVVYGVNPSASAQYWNNKVTYVGVTQLTSDVFECLNNQLKHTVSLVAPPRLPSSYMGNPVNVAVGGVITYDSSLSLVADGVKHTTDFVTNGGLSFQDSTSKEIYSLPKIFAQDANGDIADGQYKVTFNSDGTISLYMMVSWSWLQTASYPVAIDPTVVVASAYDTSGNGGRKIVRLGNGWIVTIMKSSSTVAVGYLSKDNGQTWTQWLNTTFASQTINGLALANDSSPSSTYVYLLNAIANGQVSIYQYDVSVTPNATMVASQLISTETSTGSCALLIDGSGTFHTSWNSKISAYSNSNNVRYSKGTLSGTTFTFATPTQITTLNTSGWYAQNPCIVVNSSNVPTIVWETQQGSSVNSIMAATWNGTAWNTVTVYAGGTYAQQRACSCVDGNNVIHIVWDGTDATDTTAINIRYSKSSDGGSTFTSMLKLTSGNSYMQQQSTITIDPSSNNLYVLWMGQDPVYSASLYNIRKIIYNGSWGSVTTITSDTTGSQYYPQTLWSEFNMNSTDAIRYIWQNNQTAGVDYDSITLNQPPNAPTLTTHSNFDATVAQSLAWTFSDPNTGDTQSAYQLQIVDTGNSTTVIDTGKVASTTSSCSLAANALTNGHNYQWRVTTWDQSNAQGPYSSYSTFSCASAPTVTITNPANNASVAQSNLTVQFSYSDPASLAQQSYQVQLLASDDTTVIEDSGTINGTNNQYTLSTTLSNNTTYHVKVRATNSQGVTSAWADNTFSTSFTLPATPTLALSTQSGYIGLTITNPTPQGSQPTIAYNDIYRRKANTSSWMRIATNIANNGTYNDYTVASEQSYDYKVTAVGNNQTSADSAVSSQSITFNGLYIHDVNNSPNTLLNLLYQTQAKTSTWTASATPMKYAGRTRPVVEFGENDDYVLESPNVTVMTSDNQWNALESLIQSKPLLCVRDGRGRVKFSTVLTYKATDVEYGYTVDLQFTEVDYNETM